MVQRHAWSTLRYYIAIACKYIFIYIYINSQISVTMSISPGCFKTLYWYIWYNGLLFLYRLYVEPIWCWQFSMKYVLCMLFFFTYILINVRIDILYIRYLSFICKLYNYNESKTLKCMLIYKCCRLRISFNWIILIYCRCERCVQTPTEWVERW